MREIQVVHEFMREKRDLPPAAHAQTPPWEAPDVDATRVRWHSTAVRLGIQFVGVDELNRGPVGHTHTP